MPQSAPVTDFAPEALVRNPGETALKPRPMLVVPAAPRPNALGTPMAELPESSGGESAQDRPSTDLPPPVQGEQALASIPPSPALASRAPGLVGGQEPKVMSASAVNRPVELGRAARVPTGVAQIQVEGQDSSQAVIPEQVQDQGGQSSQVLPGAGLSESWQEDLPMVTEWDRTGLIQEALASLRRLSTESPRRGNAAGGIPKSIPGMASPLPSARLVPMGTVSPLVSQVSAFPEASIPAPSTEPSLPGKERKFVIPEESAVPAAPAAGPILHSNQSEEASQSPVGGIGAMGLQATTGVASPTPTQVAPPPSPLPNPVERAVAHQVSRALNRLPGGGDKSLVIRLTPPELGTVQVELRERDGGLVVILRAEDPAVQKALERLMPQLRSDIQQGDRTVVSVQTDDRTGGSPQRDFDGRGGAAMQQRQSGDQSNRRGQQGRERNVFSLGGTSAPVAVPSIAVPAQRRMSADGVDLMA